MLKSMLSIFAAFANMLKWPLIVIAVIIAIFTLLVFANYMYLYIFKGMRRKTGEHYKVKKKSIFRRLFIDAPKMYAKDIMEKDPEVFSHQGIIVFTGHQGSGKTVSMLQLAREYGMEFPKAVSLSNLGYKYADSKLESWDDLVNYQNPNGPKCGVIAINDELQNTFNSKASKNFPPEFVAIVTQNRKNRRCLLATAQSFYMLSKDIRTQCKEIRKCTTLLGCITIVHVCTPDFDESGECTKLKHKRFYFFVHDDDLRNCYDTYEVIQEMQRSGFKDRSEQYSVSNDIKAPVISIDKKISKKIK